MYLEFHYDYEAAITYYLQTLDESRKLKEKNYEACALGDLAQAYVNLKNTPLAKKYYLESATMAGLTGNKNLMASTYNNVGAIYNEAGDYDSALIFLNMADKLYNNSKNYNELYDVYNNIALSMLYKKQYARAFSYFNKNYQGHIKEGATAGVRWTDLINLSEYYYQITDFNRALFYADSALFIANKLNLLSYKADCLQLFEKIHVAKNDFKKAYESLLDWRKIDTALHSLNLSIKIAALQEKYHAQRQLEENKHLELELIAHKAQNKLSITIASVLFLIVLLSIALILLIKSNNSKLTVKNKQIKEQNKQLIELSEEQNQLVSFVAHDLNTPFATIDLWTRIALEGDQPIEPQLKTTIQKIAKASNVGQTMIRRMLDLEKEINLAGFQARIEKTELLQLIDISLDSISPIALQKEITIELSRPGDEIFIDTDPELFQRLVDNLITNALKFSYRKNKIVVEVENLTDQITLSVQDYGVGIKKDEVPFIFLKYKRISSVPTEGEPTVGLGLVLTKKIVDLLQGTIYCESELDKGTRFIVKLPKTRLV